MSQVDVVLSRDLDSRLTSREAAAVGEWLDTPNSSLHVMRDHPQVCSSLSNQNPM